MFLEVRSTVEFKVFILLRTSTLQTLEIEHSVIKEENCDACVTTLKSTIGSGAPLGNERISMRHFQVSPIRDMIPFLLSHLSSRGPEDTEGIFDNLVANMYAIRTPKLCLECSGLNANCVRKPRQPLSRLALYAD